MQYLTYDEYRRMGGELEETDFSTKEQEAEMEINFLTDRRLVLDTAIPGEVKNLVFNLIDLIGQKADYESTDSGTVASVSNDGVSVSYAKQTAKEFLDSYDDSVKKMIVKYLYGIKNQSGESLLYRGW